MTSKIVSQRKKLRLATVATFVICLLGSSQIRGQEGMKAGNIMAPSPASAPAFIDPKSLNLGEILPPPPAPGSVAAMADLESVLRVQGTRTAADAEWAGAIIKKDVFSSSDIIGPWFAKEGLPVTAKLFQKLATDSNASTDLAKERYKRDRPFVISPEVAPCVDKPKGYSYPSAYSVQVFVRAGVLAELFPAKRAELFAQAHQRAWARVIGGVHFPTDDVGGEILAKAVVDELLKSTSFHTAIEAARAEIQAVSSKG